MSRGDAPALTFDRLATALFFVAVAAAACVMPVQTDTWWHLRAGEDIWRLRRVPLIDSFSHTAYGGYWPDHEWLSQALFYGLYRVGGVRLLTAAGAALLTVTWAIVWRLTPGPLVRRLIVMSLALVASSLAWSLRPQLISLFMVALTARVLTSRRDLWLPPIIVVWANLHGAVLLGLAMIAATTAGAWLTDRPRARRLTIIAALCGALTTVTPLGVSFWTEMRDSLARINAYQISEWRPPQVGDPQYIPFWILSIAFVGLVVASRPWRLPVRTPHDLLWSAIALLPLALKSARNIPPLVVVLAPVIAALLNERVPAPTGTADRRQRPAFNVAVLAVGVGLAVLAVGYAWTARIARLGWEPLPSTVVAAVAACPENLYNRYDEGGYLIWFVRSQRVFLDGRQDPFPPELIREQLRLEATGDYRRTFDRYRIRCAFIPSASLLTDRLTTDGWQPLHRDQEWAVLAAPRPAP